jgi:hypothetical protein
MQQQQKRKKKWACLQQQLQAYSPFNEALVAAHVSKSLGGILTRPLETQTPACCAGLKRVISGLFPNGADHVTFSAA